MMTSYARLAARFNNSSLLNNGLLFQFILDDFITVFFNLQSFNLLSQREPHPSAEQTYQIHNQELIQQMKKIVSHLIGTRNDDIKRFSNYFNEGVLTKLKMHCTLFSQQADNEEKELMAMQHYAEKVWQHCMSASEALHDTTAQHAKLCTSIEKATNALQRLSKLIARVIPQFQDDENVVFFILRHKEQLDHVYGKRFIAKLFCRMYSKGLKEAEHFLIKKYMDRSFDNITPVIVKLFAELETSNL